MILSDISNYSKGFSANFDNIPISREIIGNETTFELIQYLKEDFHYSVPYEVHYEDIALNKILINYYKILADQNDIEKQIITFKKQISKYFGISYKYIDFFTIEKNIVIRGKIYISISILSALLFIITISLFILGVVMLLVKINNLC